MVGEMEGYDFILSDAISYPNNEDQSFGPQKVGFIFTNVVQLDNSKVLLESIHPFYNGDNESFITDYPTGLASSFWGSGRLPFLMETTVTLNGQSKNYNFVVIHAKSGDNKNDYLRREYDNAVLKDSLDLYYGDQNLLLLGDYNDDVDQTIAEDSFTESSYYEFINDEDYWTVTRPLSEQGYRSTVGFPDMIDHITITDELFDNYIENSVAVHYDFYDAEYSRTTTDHFAVSARLFLDQLEIALLETSDVLCSGSANGTATVSVTGGIAPYTYAWSDGQDSQTATGLAAGDYSVEVTDAIGNTVSQNLTIESAEPLEITMIEDQNINIGYLTETVTLSSESILGGTAPYSYKWITGETSGSISVSPMETTIYTLDVTDAK